MRVFVHVQMAVVVAALAGVARAEVPPDQPLPVPLTRPEMKQALEDLKDRTPRIPLPELTEADRAELGDRADSYETRLRYHYTPRNPERDATRTTGGQGGTGQAGGGQGGGGRNREQDPNMTLSYGFKVQLFWIVSRTNNCLY